MKLAANAYAIGPSLHDLERERWEEEEIKRDARDETFEKMYYWWHINLMGDQGIVTITKYEKFKQESAKKEIIKVIGEAMNDLYCNEKDCEQFESAIFAWHFSESSIDEKNVIHELLDKYIRAVVRKKWEREQEAA